MSTTYAQAKTEIRATIEEVWDGLTNPRIVRQYFFGTELSADWRRGGLLYFRGTYEGRPYEDRGTILDFEPPRLLRFSYWSNLSGVPDLPENRRIISYELEKGASAILLTISQEPVASEAEREESERNWGVVLDGLRSILEGTRGA